MMCHRWLTHQDPNRHDPNQRPHLSLLGLGLVSLLWTLLPLAPAAAVPGSETLGSETPKFEAESITVSQANLGQSRRAGQATDEIVLPQPGQPSLYWAELRYDPGVMERWQVEPNAREVLVLVSNGWRSLAYIDRYRFVNALGAIATRDQYSLVVLGQDGRTVATYQCDDTSPQQIRQDCTATIARRATLLAPTSNLPPSAGRDLVSLRLRGRAPEVESAVE